MPFLNSLNIAGSALTAQRYRMDLITQNHANIDTVRTSSGEPYKRKLAVFTEQKMNFDEILEGKKGNIGGGVKVTDVVESNAEFRKGYDPTNPEADETGYVTYSNVDSTEEQVDLLAAYNSYQANLTALNVIKAMAMKGLEIGQ